MFWIFFASIVLFLTYLGSSNSILQQRERNLCRLLMLILLSYIISFGGIVAEDNIEYVRRYIINKDISGVLSWDVFIFGSDRVIMDANYSRVPIEFGYEVLSFLGNLVGLGAPGFFFIIALFVNNEYLKLIYKSPLPVLATLFFILSPVYSQQANLIRQSIAIAFFLHSLPYLINRQIKKYILTICIGMTFHISIVMTLPLILFTFLDKKTDGLYNRIKKSLFILWGFSVLVAFGFIDPNIIVDKILFLLTGTDFARHVSLDDTLGEKVGFSILDNFLFLVMIFLHKDKDKFIYMILTGIGCIILNMSVQLIFVKRMAYYFMAVFPFYYSCILDKRAFLKKNLFKLSFGFTLFFLLIRRLFINFVINGDNPLGSAFYPFSEFFK